MIKTVRAAAPDSFDFRPLPLLRNPHAQTLLGHFLSGRLPALPSRESVVHLSDGDAVVLHDTSPPQWRPGAPVVVLVHGLTGSAASPMMIRLAGVFQKSDLRTVRMDLRGAGKALPISRLTYHGGCSDDVRAALEEIHRQAPGSPLTLVGLSLGGNMVLKLAGEAADRPVPGLARVAALAPPIDLELCAARVGHPRNRFYETFFLRELIADARARQRFFPDLPPLSFPRRMTVRRFDDLYTAPRCGFADAVDYYRRSSSHRLIGRIQVPTLVLTARDDPLIAVEPFEQLRAPTHVSIRVLRHGGHLGFLGWDGAGGVRWVERRVAEWVLGT